MKNNDSKPTTTRTITTTTTIHQQTIKHFKLKRKRSQILRSGSKPTTTTTTTPKESTNLSDSIPRELFFDEFHCNGKIENSANSSTRSNDEDVFQIQVGITFQLKITMSHGCSCLRLVINYLS